MILSGPSAQFIDFFSQYKQQQSLADLHLCIHGRNTSNEFLNTTEIINESYLDSNFNKILKIGGLHSLIKIYNQTEFESKNLILNRYNVFSYFEIAKQKGLLKKKNNEIELKNNFFVSLDESTANDIIFGSRGKYGFLLDIDSTPGPYGKSNNFKKFDIENKRMFVDVDFITSSQQQRKSIGVDFGFFVINNPRNYISSLGVKGVTIQLARRNEMSGNIPVI